MATAGRNRDGDWLDLVSELMARPLVSLPDQPVARLLNETFQSYGCMYTVGGSGPEAVRLWPPERFAPFADELYDWTLREARSVHPVLRYYLASGDGRSIQSADVPTRFADAGVQARWREAAASFGDVPHQLALPLHFGPDAHRAFVLGRADRFTSEEMTLARRVQRLLAGLDCQVTTFARWTAHGGAAATEAARAVPLTPRELAVLELLSAGHTAAAMGRRLKIAERTVQKHLERVYAKLGVADRLSAVLRAQRIGLLASSPAT